MYDYNTITQLPKDGGSLLDGIKNIFLDAGQRYVANKLPSLEEKYIADASNAAIQANTETIRAQNQGYLQSLGLSATQLFIGASVVGLGALYLLTRK